MKIKATFRGNELVKLVKNGHEVRGLKKARLIKFGLGIGPSWGIKQGDFVMVTGYEDHLVDIEWPLLPGHPGMIDARSFEFC